METLLGKTEPELVAFVQNLGEAPFRGKQLYQSLYQRRVLELAQMTNLAKPLREKLAQLAPVTKTQIVNVFFSSDGTRRYLLRLGDDPTITDDMWLAGVRKNYDGKAIVAKDQMKLDLPLV